MKKVTFLIIGLIYSISCIGQQIVLNNTAKISLSKNVEKLNKNQVSDFASKRFNRDEVALKITENSNPDHTYLIDNVLITLFYGNKIVKDTYLVEIKSGLDEMSKKDRTYTSQIRTINNNHVLVTKYIRGSVEYYDFYCYNNTYSSGVNGALQFDKSDDDKATKILDDLLSGIKFTKE